MHWLIIILSVVATAAFILGFCIFVAASRADRYPHYGSTPFEKKKGDKTKS